MLPAYEVKYHQTVAGGVSVTRTFLRSQSELRLIPVSSFAPRNPQGRFPLTSYYLPSPIQKSGRISSKGWLKILRVTMEAEVETAGGVSFDKETTSKKIAGPFSFL